MTVRAVLVTGAIMMVLGEPADATTVQVRVLNVSSDAGLVRVAVCPREAFLKPTCPFVAHAPAHRGMTTVSVAHVPPGVYAIQAHHDINANGRIDTNFFGIPVEGIGFSRDAPFRFGPPRFEDAAYSISGALVALDIALKFEP